MKVPVWVWITRPATRRYASRSRATPPIWSRPMWWTSAPTSADCGSCLPITTIDLQIINLICKNAFRVAKEKNLRKVLAAMGAKAMLNAFI